MCGFEGWCSHSFEEETMQLENENKLFRVLTTVKAVSALFCCFWIKKSQKNTSNSKHFLQFALCGSVQTSANTHKLPTPGFLSIGAADKEAVLKFLDDGDDI